MSVSLKKGNEIAQRNFSDHWCTALGWGGGRRCWGTEHALKGTLTLRVFFHPLSCQGYHSDGESRFVRGQGVRGLRAAGCRDQGRGKPVASATMGIRAHLVVYEVMISPLLYYSIEAQYLQQATETLTKPLPLLRQMKEKPDEERYGLLVGFSVYQFRR